MIFLRGENFMTSKAMDSEIIFLIASFPKWIPYWYSQESIPFTLDISG